MNAPTPPMLRRVLRFGLDELEGLRALLIYAVAVGLLALTLPLTVQAVIQNVAAGGLRQPLLVLSGLLLLGLILSAAFTLAQIVLVELAARRIFVHTAERFVDRLRVRSDEAPRKTSFVDYFYDVITIEKSFTALVLDGLAVALQILVGTALLAVYHPALLAFDLVLILLISAPFILSPAAARTARAESTAKFAVGGWLKVLASDPDADDQQTQRVLDEWLEARRRHFRLVLTQTGALVGTQGVAIAGLLALGGWLVIEGQLTLGQLVAAELVMTATVSSLARLGKLLPKYYDLGAALAKVDKGVSL